MGREGGGSASAYLAGNSQVVRVHVATAAAALATQRPSRDSLTLPTMRRQARAFGIRERRVCHNDREKPPVSVLLAGVFGKKIRLKFKNGGSRTD